MRIKCGGILHELSHMLLNLSFKLHGHTTAVVTKDKGIGDGDLTQPLWVQVLPVAVKWRAYDVSYRGPVEVATRHRERLPDQKG